MDNLKVVLARYEVHAIDGIDTVIVGFNLECTSNGKSRYIGALVPLNTLPEGFTESAVVDVAWNNLAGTVQAWYDEVKNLGALVGSTYVPGTGIVDA